MVIYMTALTWTDVEVPFITHVAAEVRVIAGIEHLPHKAGNHSMSECVMPLFCLWIAGKRDIEIVFSQANVRQSSMDLHHEPAKFIAGILHVRIVMGGTFLAHVVGDAVLVSNLTWPVGGREPAPSWSVACMDLR